MVRYRTGTHHVSGQLLTGWAHVEQSVGLIITTVIGERVMRLDFGANTVRHLGRNLVAVTALAVYRDSVRAIHRWEPEYRVTRCQLVRLDATGGLALTTRGTYYPEGRLGNYDIAEPADAAIPLVAAQVLGAGAVGAA